ncbi:MAG: hypothetical protein ACJAYU_002131 [Bradymonadia bacterium]|jgi:hypothetical protein
MGAAEAFENTTNAVFADLRIDNRALSPNEVAALYLD